MLIVVPRRRFGVHGFGVGSMSFWAWRGLVAGGVRGGGGGLEDVDSARGGLRSVWARGLSALVSLICWRLVDIRVYVCVCC